MKIKQAQGAVCKFISCPGLLVLLASSDCDGVSIGLEALRIKLKLLKSHLGGNYIQLYKIKTLP